MMRARGNRSVVLVNTIDSLAATLSRRTGGDPVDRASWHVRASARASQ
jgi:hypothetical protein